MPPARTGYRKHRLSCSCTSLRAHCAQVSKQFHGAPLLGRRPIVENRGIHLAGKVKKDIDFVLKRRDELLLCPGPWLPRVGVNGQPITGRAGKVLWALNFGLWARLTGAEVRSLNVLRPLAHRLFQQRDERRDVLAAGHGGGERRLAALVLRFRVGAVRDEEARRSSGAPRPVTATCSAVSPLSFAALTSSPRQQQRDRLARPLLAFPDRRTAPRAAVAPAEARREHQRVSPVRHASASGSAPASSSSFMISTSPDLAARMNGVAPCAERTVARSCAGAA